MDSTQKVPREVLNKIDRDRKAAIVFLSAAAVIEALCLVALILVVDLEERLQLVVLLSTFLIYGGLGFGLAALGTYTRMWNLRVLKALELVAADCRAKNSRAPNP